MNPWRSWSRIDGRRSLFSTLNLSRSSYNSASYHVALTAGTRLGPYDVTAQIGAGGMGEVYRATDTNLKRSVAIKVLPGSVAADDDRLARFQREAEVLASLNHPNIAAIYGLERSGGTTALVMELVEGPTLADRIAQGAIPLDEAVAIAKQIAEALDAAHEQGVIHRDLKPANVKVRPDGAVKVLDFGLAKAMEPASALRASAGHAGGVPALSMSPTIATPMMTQAGIILGTAAYMSPEQARGRPVDKRADIWAFGAVLFEMLTAVRAFPGDEVTDTIVSVISKEPDWSALPPSTPASIRSLLRRCLEKDHKRRLRDIGEGRLSLEGGFETAAPQQTTAVSSAPLVWKVALALAAVAIVGLGVPALRHLSEASPPAAPETRVEIVTPSTDEPTSFALSPDGRRVVFVASDDSGPRLWLRSLSATTALPLAGTERAMYPFWAPDGRALGFFADGALKRLDFVDAGVSSGKARILAQATNGTGGTWSEDGVIIFAPTLTTVLMRVPATGGAAVAITTLGPQHAGHLGPQFLPDGHRFLFYVFGGADVSGIYLGALDGRTPTRLTAADGAGVFVPEGPEPDGALRRGNWVLWLREGALVGQQLDVEQGVLIGEPVSLADGVSADRRLRPGLSAAATGLVAYRTGGASQRQLTWLDRSGAARGTVGEIDGTLDSPRVSPDGRRVLVQRVVQGNRDVWLMDGARTSRVTFEPSREDFPVWSPDGTEFVFRSNRLGPFDIFRKAASGAGAEEQLATSDQLKSASSMSADGRFLLYLSIDPQTDADMWVMPMTGDRKPSVIAKTPFREVWPVFSPDGRWMAYQSNESGRPEIYIRAFVAPGETGAKAPGGQWQVSTSGGIRPAWRSDGKELYYLDPAGAMMAAPITATASAIEPGAPVKLFPTRIFGGGVDAQQGPQYSVALDGRFLINTELDVADAPITLLMNWNPDAKKR